MGKQLGFIAIVGLGAVLYGQYKKLKRENETKIKKQ